MYATIGEAWAAGAAILIMITHVIAWHCSEDLFIGKEPEV